MSTDLPIKSRVDIVIIPETIVAEIKLNRKRLYYRDPNIPVAEVKNFLRLKL